MKKEKLNFNILKEEVGFSAYTNVEDYFIATQGDTFQELQENIIEATNLSFEEEGIIYGIDDIKFTFDLPSFFENYQIINAKALSKRIGMNQSLLAQYVHGKKKPSPRQMQKIIHGIQEIGKELSEIGLMVK